ncbi:tyrosine-type recombinase/integrase [Dactylosporangium sp. CA-152071]|uniref:tyrosine-type recombinase/integrase n=1 Tax=Dactylosporangium sp. CA-152071 TaxID=3239933 RepID=UPI003D8E533C
MVAVGGGDVGVAGEAEDVDGGVAEGGHDLRAGAGADLGSVFVVGDVADPYAVLSLLARLGLRSAEAAGLQLGDIDWRAGEVAVRGKGSRVERLPLPAAAGQALAGWLTDGRPRCESRAVFVTVRQPYRQLTPDAVRQVMARACGRAGLTRRGAHRLRHTLATEMLRAGASLPEVGQVLRHRSQLSTAIYAKVDQEALRPLARRWPGAGR